jgi:antitoxin PrlF
MGHPARLWNCACALTDVSKWWYYFLQKVKDKMESALSIKGQATIPKAIREHLHLGPGDRIKFFVHPDGSVVILPKVRTSALKGIVRAPKRRVSVDEMEAGAVAGATGRIQRMKRR